MKLQFAIFLLGSWTSQFFTMSLWVIVRDWLSCRVCRDCLRFCLQPGLMKLMARLIRCSLEENILTSCDFCFLVVVQSLALELGKDNIRVNAIASGMFNTEITENLFTKNWMKEVAGKVVPMRRWGVINPDLTSLVFLLCSDHSSYITGNVFIVDGGQSLPSVPIWSSL